MVVMNSMILIIIFNEYLFIIDKIWTDLSDNGIGFTGGDSNNKHNNKVIWMVSRFNRFNNKI